MSGTVAGGKLAAQTNKLKHGETFYQEIGRIGGRNGRGHTFGHGKVDPAIAGRKGGLISKRGKAKPVIEQPKRRWFAWLGL